MESEVPCVEFVYQRLVQLVARAFYSVDLNILLNEEPPEASQPPAGSKRKRQPADFTGLGVVVMDALMNRPWWEEEEFARKLGLPVRAVRQVLRLLETHAIVAREHRKERKRKANDEQNENGGNDPVEADVVEENTQERGNLISYCSLDYQALFDATRYRLHKIRRKLKEELEDRRAVAEYLCAVCNKSYTTLQAPFLIKADGLFHCEECDTVLESATDGQADGLSRRERNKAVKAKQAKLEAELQPLTQLLADIERRVTAGEEIPDFGTLAAWASREAIRSGVSSQGGRRTNGGGRSAAEAQINISIEGAQTAAASGGEAAAPRELPPWLQRQQNGSVGASTSYSLSQEMAADVKDVKSASPGDEKKAEEVEYMQQYKVRMEQMAAQQADPGGKWQSEAGGWQEVPPSGGGWEEVNPAAPAVKQETGQGAAEAGGINAQAGGAEEDEDEWEDA